MLTVEWYCPLWQQEWEAAGHVACGPETAGNAAAPLAFPLSCSPGL